MHDCPGRPAKIITINDKDTIQNAAALMLSHNVGCLIVNDDEGKFAGLVSERDIAHYVAKCHDAGQTSVSQIMTDHVISCAARNTTGEARQIMTEHRIRHLPIVENGVVVGILSARDVMAQQLLEDRAAAEEVAMLSKCLKSIDLAEAVEIVAAGIAQAVRRQQLRLVPVPAGRPHREPELVSSNRCPVRGGPPRARKAWKTSRPRTGTTVVEIPAECAGPGGQPPRLVLPLDIVGLPEATFGQGETAFGILSACAAWRRRTPPIGN